MAFRRTIAAGNRYKDQTPRVQIVNPFCLAQTTQIRYNKKDYTEYKKGNAIYLTLGKGRSHLEMLQKNGEDGLIVGSHWRGLTRRRGPAVSGRVPESRNGAVRSLGAPKVDLNMEQNGKLKLISCDI